MGRHWKWVIAALLGVVIGYGSYAYLWLDQATVVPVEIASYAPATRILGVNGRIDAVHMIDVRTQITGRIAAITVEEGVSVEIDQSMVEIDAQAQSAVVRQAIAGLDAAVIARQDAFQDYNRAVSLGENISRTALASTSMALQAADQEVSRQTAILDQAQILLETYTVRAPITGRVLSLDAEVGQLVGASAPLLTLVDDGDVIVAADVDEAYATQIKLDQAAVLQLAGEDMTRTGHVSFVSRRVDEGTGGLAIKLAFGAPVSAPIGMTVTANIVVDAREAALTVPRAAIVQGQNGPSVFVVQDGMAVPRAVSVVEWPAARLIVLSGLVAGDTVIVDATGIKEGQAVKVDQP
ncbi:efflux RND transporter periplasmic adaptor subunit [Yoonia sp. MH D7]